MLPILFANLIILISLSVDRWYEIGWIKSLVFPCVWTGVWNLVVFTWPVGDYFNYAHVLLGINEMMQFASFAGLGGLNFILSWGGSVGADLIKKYLENDLIVRIQKESSSPPSPTIDPNRHEDLGDQHNDEITVTVIPQNKNKNDNKPFIFKPPKSLLIYLLALFMIITYGSIKLSTSYIPFYQQNIEKFTSSKLTKVGCVIKGNDIFDDNQYYIDRTIELASNNNELILWSETAGLVTRQEELDNLIVIMKNISVSYSTTIGFTFLDEIIKDRSYNRLIVITPSGEVAIDYRKSHLVPISESILTRGENQLQTFESDNFGVVGAAICFDYNFPSLIGQASTKNVDFMLDSRPSGIYHPRINVIRTIENGFTMMRCDRYGISGVWDSNGQTYNAVPTLSNLTISFDFPIKKRTKTVYGVFGESLGYICLVLALIIVSLLAFFKFSKQENIKKKIKKWI
ncbi:8671_t:CDS:2 [Entrophospora sp. SA101]|nr:8671_t:CDS:2 [Entrophospora sp. SA101]